MHFLLQNDVLSEIKKCLTETHLYCFVLGVMDFIVELETIRGSLMRPNW